MVEIKTDLCSRVPCSSTVRNKTQSEGWDVLEKPNPCVARLVKHLILASKRTFRKRAGAPQVDEAVTLKTFNKALAYEPNLVNSNKITSARFSCTCLLQYIHFTFDLVTSCFALLWHKRGDPRTSASDLRRAVIRCSFNRVRVKNVSTSLWFTARYYNSYK